MDKQTKDKMTSSGKDDWETPNWLFRWADEGFGPITLDVCATEENAKCENFISPEEDALEEEWHIGRCWMNPPYSSKMQNRFVEKAFNETWKAHAGRVVALLPVRTSTHRWHDYVMKSDAIYFIRGRIQFVGAENGAVFPSCVVIWDAVREPTWPRIKSVDRDRIKEEYQ